MLRRPRRAHLAQLPRELRIALRLERGGGLGLLRLERRHLPPRPRKLALEMDDLPLEAHDLVARDAELGAQLGRLRSEQ